MNIGETDADGWTYVRFGDAAKAAQEGTHEVQQSLDGAKFSSTNVFVDDGCREYRVRKKARTITVTIPRPDETVGCGHYSAQIVFHARPDKAEATVNAIRAAMRQQP